MDMAGKDSNIEPLKGNDDHVNYSNTPNMSSDWHVNGNNITHTSIGMITMGNSMVESSACSSASMVDSFCFPTWDQPMNGQTLGYCDMNLQNDASTSSSFVPIRGNTFPPNVTGVFPQSLPHFPDSAFIERAARFSCFGGGNFGEMMNMLSNRALGPIQGPNEAHEHEMEVFKEGLLPREHETEGGSIKDEKRTESFIHSHEEVKNGFAVSCNQSDEEASSGKGLGSKKRKSIEHNENNDTSETKQKSDQSPSSSSKPGKKNGNPGSLGPDPPKEDYIHIRARRGQATNSHSLAERVRREKISERMKFLQDLVPGCSKVTGKAVMLDEIINYVQSLQRQVEFLSMKLSAVNPRLDFNIEGLLTKDILQPRIGLSSSLPFPPDMSMPFSPLHPSQPRLIQAGLPGMGNSSEALRRPNILRSTLVLGGFKEPTSQVANVWEDELHNVVHMGFNSSNPHTGQDLSGSLPSGHTKPEP
ncbi:hypothetical protein BUALT_Bualt05G0137100 [Buddleja alternifolia]|uniref:BHLH domain-containing protein n=1 Tax=Buddleja alternifolia TaxID=168488 RepID=A0AAV6XV36_9LAMI|nr:hypothetical protein BUALT_Bualt05G0137100 [Buddleja alternifolia]